MVKRQVASGLTVDIVIALALSPLGGPYFGAGTALSSKSNVVNLCG